MPVILATQEAEIRRIAVQSQPRAINCARFSLSLSLSLSLYLSIYLSLSLSLSLSFLLFCFDFVVLEIESRMY
jgi:hypothetical protein